MSAAEIIEQLKALPREERKAVLLYLSEDLEETGENKLFDERSSEPKGRPLRDVLRELRIPE